MNTTPLHFLDEDRRKQRILTIWGCIGAGVFVLIVVLVLSTHTSMSVVDHDHDRTNGCVTDFENALVVNPNVVEAERHTWIATCEKTVRELHDAATNP